MAGTRILFVVLTTLLYCASAQETDVNACVAFPCGVNAVCADLPNPAPNTTAGRNCTCNPTTPAGNPKVMCYACNANATLENSTRGGDRNWGRRDYDWGRGRGGFGFAAPHQLRCVCNAGFTGNGTTCKAITACMQYPCQGCANCTVNATATHGRTCTCPCGLYSEWSGCSLARPSVNLTRTTITTPTAAPSNSVESWGRYYYPPGNEPRQVQQYTFTAVVNGTCGNHTPTGFCIFGFRSMATRLIPLVNGTCAYNVTVEDCPDQSARVQYSGDKNFQAFTTQIGQSYGRY